MDTFLGIAGLLVGIAGLIIAWFQYEGKRKLTHAFKSALKGMTGNITKIQQSTNRKAFSVRILAIQAFPSKGLKKLFMNRKDKNIHFCLAFVDTADASRSIKGEIRSFTPTSQNTLSSS